MTMPLAVSTTMHATPATWACGQWQSRYVPGFTSRPVPRRLLTEPMIAALTLPNSEIRLQVYQPEPAWLYPVLDRVQHLSRLGSNWDSYGGCPPTDEAVYTALAVLASILQDDSVPPTMVPTSEGGIQLEWHRPGEELEVRVAPKGEVSAFRFNETAGQAEELEHVTLSNLTPLVDLTGRL